MSVKGWKARKKKYTDNLHEQPYDFEGSVFDGHHEDPDYDPHDLARWDSEVRDAPDPLTQLDLSKHGGSQKMLTRSAEFGTDADDVADHVSEMGGRGRRKPDPVTQQLVQDAGGYSIEVDPRTLWKTATVFYCKSCGEWIGSPARQRLECEVPLDPCTSEMLNSRGGCQNCREQRALDLKEARGIGNPPNCCRPQPGEKESRCARDWRNRIARWKRAITRAEKLGSEPPPAPQPATPKWTDHDLRRIRIARDDAWIRARQAERADPVEVRRQMREMWPDWEFRPKPEPKPKRAGSWDQTMNGTGFDSRDHLRKPGWSNYGR